jgi:hypothetical protein
MREGGSSSHAPKHNSPLFSNNTAKTLKPRLSWEQYIYIYIYVYINIYIYIYIPRGRYGVLHLISGSWYWSYRRCHCPSSVVHPLSSLSDVRPSVLPSVRHPSSSLVRPPSSLAVGPSSVDTSSGHLSLYLASVHNYFFTFRRCGALG